MESKNNWKAWLYLAPALILLSVFTFFPIINTVIVSFTKDYDVIDASFSGFTFDNYIDILTPIHNANGNDGTAFESVMLIGLPNTLLLTFITVPISIILSLIIAICLNSIKFFKKIFKADKTGKQETVRRDMPKVGRNDPCPCGSGKKYKNCCGRNA